jgi:hypothetical protein
LCHASNNDTLIAFRLATKAMPNSIAMAASTGGNTLPGAGTVENRHAAIMRQKTATTYADLERAAIKPKINSCHEQGQSISAGGEKANHGSNGFTRIVECLKSA